jgi:hypothetical protein
MVVHTCNSSIQEASPGYVKDRLKGKLRDLVFPVFVLFSNKI